MTAKGMWKLLLAAVFWLASLQSCTDTVTSRTSQETVQGHRTRVVTLAPSLCLLVHALGGDRLLAGVTDECPLRFGSSGRPVAIGKYNAMPNLEVLIKLQPAVILVPWESRPVVEHLRPIGAKLVVIKSDRLQDIVDAPGLVGKALSMSEEGAELEKRLKTKLQEVSRALSRLQRVRTLMIIGRGGEGPSHLFAVGPGSYLHDIIVAAGGANVLASSPAAYPQLSAEDVIRLAPECIVEVVDRRTGAVREKVLESWRKLDAVPAVRHGNVHVIDDPMLLVPGPQAVDWVRRIAELLHPEVQLGR